MSQTYKIYTKQCRMYDFLCAIERSWEN